MSVIEGFHYISGGICLVPPTDCLVRRTKNSLQVESVTHTTYQLCSVFSSFRAHVESVLVLFVRDRFPSCKSLLMEGMFPMRGRRCLPKQEHKSLQRGRREREGEEGERGRGGGERERRGREGEEGKEGEEGERGRGGGEREKRERRGRRKREEENK